MAENTLKEDDDDELIVVETDELPPQTEIDAKSDDEDDEDDEDGEDARLADSQDDLDEEIVNKNRKKREKRRKLRKEAQERAERELRMLREQNAQLSQRLAAVEGHTISNNEALVDQRINEAHAEVRQAELILARAIESGNGDDAAQALQLRDAAKQNVQQLEAAKVQLSATRQAPQPGGDPSVQRFAKDWMAANPWYNPSGTDQASAITNEIDRRLVAEGYDPRSVDYWNELTSRVSERFSGDTESKGEKVKKKKAPPMGNSREHAPQSTRKEVYVTPERKQAMIDAGIWDDPVRRTRMLKEYQAYDRNSAR